MKTIFLLAIFSLSITSFAQLHHLTVGSANYKSESIKCTKRIAFDIHGADYLSFGYQSHTITNGSLIQVYDSIYRWVSTDPIIGLKLDYKTIEMAYDDSYNLTGKLMQKWNGSAWVNYYQYLYTYDAGNNLTSEVIQVWVAGEWIYYRQYIFAYDANNNLGTELHLQWNDNKWENDNFITYTYDSYNNLISEIFQNWNGLNWINLTKEKYTYDPGNNPIIKLYQYWNGSAWVDDYRFLNTFNANNSLIDATLQTWNGSDWLYRSQYNYTYDAHNNMITEFKQEWINGNWVNSTLRVRNYDSYDNQTFELLQNWNGTDWANSQRYTYIYDDDNFKISQSFEYWNMAGTQVLGGDSIHYYFHTVLGINEHTTQEIISVYPNPNKGKFSVQCHSKVFKTEVYNISGNLIQEINNLNPCTTNVFDLRSFPKGCYIIKIYTDAKVFATKVIYQ